MPIHLTLPVISPFRPFTLRIRGSLISFERPVVMGILNLTPDSFYPGSRISADEVAERAGMMIADGAVILDLGGQSTRPGAEQISAGEEAERVIPSIAAVRRAFPDVIISVDTYYAKVAEAAVEAGACIINDVSAGSLDPEIPAVAARRKVPYILMHMKGNPRTMHSEAVYDDVTDELVRWFSGKICLLREMGIHDVLIDPGFGFGKLSDHNYRLLGELETFGQFGVPVIAGVSRKKMIQHATGKTAGESLDGTTAANTIALMNGASVLRVHDVAAASDAVSVFMETAKAARSRF
jgi:dihydropteroate synthase